MPYQIASDTKLQAFQYRLTHRIIPCNKYLANICIKTNSTCSYCDSEDTLQHFFFHCQSVQALWRNLLAWHASNADIHLQLNAKDTLFGIPKNSEHAPVINFLILFTKYYVYRQWLFHQNQLSVLQVLQDLPIRLPVEKYINTQENKPYKLRKWERILNALG